MHPDIVLTDVVPLYIHQSEITTLRLKSDDRRNVRQFVEPPEIKIETL